MKARKRLRLNGYDYGQAGAYFVTVCTKEKKCILGSVVGADDYIGPYVELSSTGKVVDQYLRMIPGVDYCVVMPNHVHMILRISAKDIVQGPMWSSAPTKANISSLVRTWKTLITKHLGHSIWQRSFYDHIIRDEKEYLKIAQYIEENPARWLDDSYYSQI